MAKIVLEVANGWVVLQASLKSPAGVPRFRLEFPKYLRDDLGAEQLVVMDFQGGYEARSRDLLEKVLQNGDLFVDVGAHWGYFTLQAATHPAGAVRVIAFEPDPANAAILFHNIIANDLAGVADLVCAACGESMDMAPLVSNSSMGHSIGGVGIQPPFVQGPPKWVPIVPLDTALAKFPQHAGRRVILKVDAEGFETRVIAGARELISSGRVALIVWECGHAFVEGPGRGEMIAMVESLSAQGFRHFRVPGEYMDGPYLPFTLDELYNGNVFSMGAGLNV
jgi:FkbM family methyltransferase